MSKQPVLKALVKKNVLFVDGYDLEVFIKKVYKKEISLREDQDYEKRVVVKVPSRPKFDKYEAASLATFLKEGHERGCHHYMQEILKDLVLKGLIKPATYVVATFDD